jgi:hypothetical protein
MSMWTPTIQQHDDPLLMETNCPYCGHKGWTHDLDAGCLVEQWDDYCPCGLAPKVALDQSRVGYDEWDEWQPAIGQEIDYAEIRGTQLE